MLRRCRKYTVRSMDERILQDMKESYGMECRSFSRVNGGFLNELWRAETACGTVLVKIYSRKRFHEKKLLDIEKALKVQWELHQKGVLCPRVYERAGAFVRRMQDGTAYMVMDYCDGRNESARTITCRQMQSLGYHLAKMHAAMDEMQSGALDSAETAAQLREHAALYGDEQIKRIAAEWTEEKIAAQQTALRHEDMTQDNVLFDDAGVTAIIDFDRVRSGFALHDVGRAILSFALCEDTLSEEKLRAFAAGYGAVLPLSCADMAQALRIAWLCEVMWWTGPKAEKLTGKAKRFREEILWLTENYFALDEMIDAACAQGI